MSQLSTEDFVLTRCDGKKDLRLKRSVHYNWMGSFLDSLSGQEVKAEWTGSVVALTDSTVTLSVSQFSWTRDDANGQGYTYHDASYCCEEKDFRRIEIPIEDVERVFYTSSWRAVSSGTGAILMGAGTAAIFIVVPVMAVLDVFSNVNKNAYQQVAFFGLASIGIGIPFAILGAEPVRSLNCKENNKRYWHLRHRTP